MAEFNGTSWAKYTVDDGMAAAQVGNIMAVYADSKGNVWIGTMYGGINKFKIPADKTCTTLQFQAGWNLFSTPVSLDSARVGFNFQSLIDKGSLVKIQDELGNAFEYRGIFGGWDDSEMKLIRPYEGFKINVNKNDSVQFCGTPVSYPYPVCLDEGWNFMGYPQSIVANAQEVAQELIDHGTLVKVQDETGRSIENLGTYGGWTNFIGNFVPGEGYKIKLSSRDTLWIYEGYQKATFVAPSRVQPRHFKSEYYGNGVDHMNFNIVDLPTGLLNAGDELAVFDGTVCVGALTLLPQDLNSGVVAVTVSAADNYGMPGFGEGNMYSLRLWQEKSQSEQTLHPDILSGPGVFVKHESAILSLKNFNGLEKGNIGSESVNCYPNPFNTELIVEANFLSDRTVSVQVINQLGQHVNFLVNKQRVSAGIYRWAWKGDNGSGQKAEPGVYYIRISADDNTVVHKVVLTK